MSSARIFQPCDTAAAHAIFTAERRAVGLLMNHVTESGVISPRSQSLPFYSETDCRLTNKGMGTRVKRRYRESDSDSSNMEGGDPGRISTRSAISFPMEARARGVRKAIRGGRRDGSQLPKMAWSVRRSAIGPDQG